MSYSAEIIDYKGKEAVALTAGKYKAIVAPFLGSNVIRMQDVENDIEIFRYEMCIRDRYCDRHRRSGVRWSDGNL